MILGTAGHIDHGKTALVHALSGVNTDRLPEEQRRGITIELGFAPLTLDDGTVLGIVDVPGHEAFVRTMVSGASGIDLALLIVAADESVMPQTREHADILRLLGVSHGVVALTKCDLVDAEWLALVKQDVAAFLQETSLRDAPIVETSVRDGRGIAELRDAITRAARAAARAPEDDLFRLPVDRSFTLRGTGTVVTGTVWSGAVKRDDVVRILPGDRTARVRSIQSHDHAVDVTPHRGRTALALANVEPDDVPRSSVLVREDAWTPTTLLRADVELLAGAPQLGPRTSLRFHLATADVGARVVARGGALQPGERRPVRVALDHPVVARAGDRFVLRGGATGATLGGGIVTDPIPPRRRPSPLPRTDLNATERLELFLSEAGGRGVAESALPIRLGVLPAAVDGLLRDVDAVRVAGHAWSPAAVEHARARLLSMVADYHAAQPLEEGISRQTLRARLGVAPSLADRLVDEGARSGQLQVTGAAVARAGWAPRIDPGDQRLLDQLRAELQSSGLEPPTVSDLVGRYGPAAAHLLRLMERRGEIELVGGDRYYLPATLQGLMRDIRQKMSPDVLYTPAELRELVGLPRRLLIPLLEYADRTGVTARRSEGRLLAQLPAGLPRS